MRQPGPAGLILAAGAGTRFGPDAKLLAALDGRPLLEHVVESVCAVARLEPVVVVLGARAEQLRERVAFGRARTVVCQDWSRGLSASLRCGIEALPDADRVVVALGDSPTLTPELLRRFLDAPGGTRAAYAGVPGHPVVLGAEQLSRLRELGGDVGARGLLAGAATIECSDLASGLDVDRPEDLRALRRRD